MWFAKLFGGRRHRSADEEPIAVKRPPVPNPNSPAPKRDLAPHAHSNAHTSAKRKGFDPYNSDCFDSRNAWKRVGRR